MAKIKIFTPELEQEIIDLVFARFVRNENIGVNEKAGYEILELGPDWKEDGYAFGMSFQHDGAALGSVRGILSAIQRKYWQVLRYAAIIMPSTSKWVSQEVLFKPVTEAPENLAEILAEEEAKVAAAEAKAAEKEAAKAEREAARAAKKEAEAAKVKAEKGPTKSDILDTLSEHEEIPLYYTLGQLSRMKKGELEELLASGVPKGRNPLGVDTEVK